MNCPSCDKEMAIGHSYVEVEDDKAYTVQTLYCRNKGQCVLGSSGLPVRQLRHLHNDIPIGLENVTMCCGGLIANIDDGTYFVPEYVDHAAKDGVLTACCPECGSTHEFFVGEKVSK